MHYHLPVGHLLVQAGAAGSPSGLNWRVGGEEVPDFPRKVIKG